MNIHCSECGQFSLKETIIRWLRDWRTREKYYAMLLESQSEIKALKYQLADRNDRLHDLSGSYRDLADCYKSMQVSVAAIRSIYGQMDERVKKMKRRTES